MVKYYTGYNKYNAQKIRIGDRTFDSKKEAERYQELVFLQKQGIIKNLQTQVKFVLIPTQKDKNGKVIERECSYVADFVYYLHGEKIVEDIKSEATKTPQYKIKKKLMLYFHGIHITET